MSLKYPALRLGERLPAPEALLGLIGLQQQRHERNLGLTMLGSFALGTLLGSALALLFAPRTGRQLRHDRGERLDDVTQRVKQNLGRYTDGETHPS
jgi:hypothetical protein